MVEKTKGFTEADRKCMKSLLDKVTKMEKTMKTMKNNLKKANEVIVDQRKMINDLRSEINKTNYHNDSLQQYGRRESIRIHGITNETNAEKVIKDIAEEI